MYDTGAIKVTEIAKELRARGRVIAEYKAGLTATA